MIVVGWWSQINFDILHRRYCISTRGARNVRLGRRGADQDAPLFSASQRGGARRCRKRAGAVQLVLPSTSINRTDCPGTGCSQHPYRPSAPSCGLQAIEEGCGSRAQHFIEGVSRLWNHGTFFAREREWVVQSLDYGFITFYSVFVVITSL